MNSTQIRAVNNRTAIRTVSAPIAVNTVIHPAPLLRNRNFYRPKVVLDLLSANRICYSTKLRSTSILATWSEVFCGQIIKKLSLRIIPFILFSFPLITYAAPKNFKELVGIFVRFIASAIPTLLLLTLLAFIFGLLKYVAAGGDEEKTKEGRQYIMYGIIGIFVMSCTWGLVNIVIKTFFP